MSKIAIIGTAFPFRGGIAAFTERLATQFQDDGHDVTIYTFTLQYPSLLFPGKSQYSNDSAPKHLKIIPLINSINPLNWLSAGKQIAKENFDFVIVKFWIPFMGPCLGTISRIIKKNSKSRLLAIMHNVVPHEAKIGDIKFTRYFINAIDSFICLSKDVLADLQKFTKKKSMYSPHPLYDNYGEKIDKQIAIKKLGLSPDTMYILFFGLIRKYKGLDLLINAMATDTLKNQNITLLVAGEFYDNRTNYESLIDKLKLNDRIIINDKFIPNDEVALYFSACDLVVQPYKTATQSGITQIAYHFNKPMVVTNVGALPEMCPNDEVGYVAEPNAIEIAKAIGKFIDCSDKSNFEENIKTIKKQYEWNILTKKIEMQYQELG